MSSKATKERAQARAILHEARANDMRAILQRVAAVAEGQAAELARNALAQDAQRMLPELVREYVRALKEANDEGS